MTKPFSLTLSILAWTVVGALCEVCAPGEASAAPPVRDVAVSGPRIRLRDILKTAPVNLQPLDLGATPAPNGSRLITRQEIEALLRENGVTAMPSLPEGVRVLRMMTNLSTSQVELLATRTLTDKMPAGAVLKRVRAGGSAYVPVGWDRAVVSVPRPPHRIGAHTQVVELKFEEGGQTISSLLVTLEMDLGPLAARYEVPRGTRVTLVAEHGSVQIRTVAITTQDGDVGSVVSATVKESGKVLRVRLAGTDHATLEEQS
jgi:hypothetical protein